MPAQSQLQPFQATVWSDVTPFETDFPETALAFRAELKRRREGGVRSGQPDRMPARPGILANRSAADNAGPIHVPDRGLAARVLKKDVRAAVGSDRAPTRPGIGAKRAAANKMVPAHLPDRDLATPFVLKKDVGKTVVIEIARADGAPTRSRIGAHRPASDYMVPVHLPDRDLAGARVLPEDVGLAVAIEIAGSTARQLGPGLGLTAPPPIKVFPFISQIEA